MDFQAFLPNSTMEKPWPYNVSLKDRNGSDYQGFAMGIEEYPNPFDHIEVQAVFILLYGIVFACSIIGNLLVIIVILKHKKMRSVTNFFLANLAVADLAVGVFCVLPNLSQHISPYWLLGRVMCKLMYFVQVMSYTASISILTVISIERFVAIIYPIKSKQLMTLCLLRCVIIAVWLLAACCGVPNLIFYDTLVIGDTVYCMNFRNTNAYNIVNLILLYIVPLLLMTAMYTRISLVLWRTSKQQSSGVTVGTKVCFTKRPQFSAAAAGGGGAGGSEESMMMMKPKSTEKCTATYYPNGGTTGSHQLQPMKQSPGVNNKTGTTDEESCYEDEQSQLVNVNTPNAEELPRTDSVAEDFEDDWPGNKAQVTKAESKQDLNGLRMHCKNKQLKIITSAKLRLRKVRAATNSQQHVEGALLARRRVIRLLMAVIISFAMCVLPYHVRVIWHTYNEPQFTFWETLFTPITFVIYYLNSALNPMLYAFLSVNFRRSLWQVLRCEDHKSGNRNRNTSMASYSRTVNTTL